MTDYQFQKLLNRAAKAGRRYKALLEQAEEEYERRFGFNPSDGDDDHWIDSLTLSGGEPSAPTVAEITAAAKLCKPR